MDLAIAVFDYDKITTYNIHKKKNTYIKEWNILVQLEQWYN